jgi:hypothetical protein
MQEGTSGEYKEYRTAPHWCNNRNMPVRTKIQRSSRAKSVRQSVTIPAPLIAEVRRVAKERNLTMSRALVSLAERGIQADLDAKEKLKAAYKRFMDEQKPGPKNEAGKELVRAVFGKDAIAEDTLQ